jgi:hypothetical protein
MRIREIVIDIGWLILVILLIPVAIPVVAVGFIALCGKRVYDRRRQHAYPVSA